MRSPVALVLVAAALLAGPTPEAVAQAPSRQPRELWRQFPLETRRPAPRAAERESTSQVSVQIPGGTPGEGTVPTAAIVLTTALVLLLMTGVLGFAVRGRLEFGVVGRRRRLAPSFPELLANEAALDSAREASDSVAPKDELSGTGAAAKGETRVGASQQTQPVDHGTRPTSEDEEALRADTASRELDVSAAAATPVAPPSGSASTGRSTIFDLVHEHGSNVAMIGVGLIALALLLLNIAVFFGIGVEPY